MGLRHPNVIVGLMFWDILPVKIQRCNFSDITKDKATFPISQNFPDITCELNFVRAEFRVLFHVRAEFRVELDSFLGMYFVEF